MPQSIEIVGWEDYDGNRHEGVPSNVEKAWGCLVYAPGSRFVGRGDEHFWAFVPATYDNWDDWYDYIDALMDDYGESD